jgi:hypothetical protein
MEIKDLWNIQPIVGMYTYSGRMAIRELCGIRSFVGISPQSMNIHLISNIPTAEM